MTENIQFQAVPPSLGIALQRSGAEVNLRVNDNGGRGIPRKAVLFPVVRKGSRIEPVGLSDNGPPLPSSYQVITCKDEAPPYRFQLGEHLWPTQSSLVLLLLLYDQAPGIGSNVASIGPPTAPAGDAPDGAADDNVLNAIQACLAVCSADALRRGLIAQAAADAAALPAPPPLAIKSLTKTRAREPAPAARAGADPVTFALASCLYPSDIFDRMPDDEDADPGPPDASLMALARVMAGGTASADTAPPPSLLLFVGDQVYVDATAGLFDPKALDDRFRIPYERRGESRGFQAATQRFDVEVHQLIDDREIVDNWEPCVPAPEGEKPDPIDEGRSAYWRYQRFDAERLQIWRDDIVHRRLPFFLGDTRTEREQRNVMNAAAQRIMSTDQFDALKAWLTSAANSGLPKFVATPSALLPRSLAVARDAACAIHADAWEGYPASLHALLAFACDHELEGLVFLSGDEHLSNAVEATVTRHAAGGSIDKTCTLHSVHSSGLYAPYPFANAVVEDFAGHERFCFTAADDEHVTHTYTCRVCTSFASEGDGFALVTTRPAAGGWQIDVEFHDAAGRKNSPAGTDVVGWFVACRGAPTAAAG